MQSQYSNADISRADTTSPDYSLYNDNGGRARNASHSPPPDSDAFGSWSSPASSDASGSWSSPTPSNASDTGSSQIPVHTDNPISSHQPSPDPPSTSRFKMTAEERTDLYESAKQNTLSKMSDAFKKYQQGKSVCESLGATRTDRSDSGWRIPYTRKQRAAVFDRKCAGGELDATIKTAKEICGSERVNARLKRERVDYTGSVQSFIDAVSEEEQNHKSGSEGFSWGSSERSNSDKGSAAIEDIRKLW